MELFGLNIAEIINDAVNDAGGLTPGKLTHLTIGARDVSNPTGGTNPTETIHIFQGIISKKQIKRDNQVSAFFETTISILSDSLKPGVVPAVNDFVDMGGIRYTLIELLSVDPSLANYKFKAER